MGDIKPNFPLSYRNDIHASKKEYAQSLDAQDPLQRFREQFFIPSKEDLGRKTLADCGGIPIFEALSWSSLI
jgi:kynureninase